MENVRATSLSFAELGKRFSMRIGLFIIKGEGISQAVRCVKIAIFRQDLIHNVLRGNKTYVYSAENEYIGISHVMEKHRIAPCE